jgi:Fe-Mn family superoxide dismutase
MLTRRDALRAAAAAVLVPAAARLTPAAAAFTLPQLPYAFDALEPFIDAKTMEIHSQRHHKTYVDNLNKAVEGTDWANKPVAEVIADLKAVPEDKRGAVRNNGGGHYNHTLFWQIMAKPGAGGGGAPKGELARAIDAAFGSLDKFRAAFKAAALGRFGSGWAWLVPGKEKPLAIVSSPNQDNPLMDGGPAPILGIDVWEHAYYLKYQNKRADYVDAWWNVVNWDAVAANLAAAKKG